jgi:CDP-diacylglycerol--glycerol-3-phosphate 3-phosphatidyltransferase
MNLPNRLTCYRIVLTVVFMLLLFAQGLLPKVLALATFLIASFTDYWDGKVARERGQITAFGKLMDPVADKVLTLSAFLAFVQMGILPAWMVVVIIARDLLITGIRLVLPANGPAQAARPSGKHKTALQLASILGVLIFLTAKETPWWRAEWTPAAHGFIYYGMVLIVAVTLSSGVWYLLQNREALREPAR